MKPLICFFDGQLIESRKYRLFECPTFQSVSEFLKQIAVECFSELKIVQINFEYDSVPKRKPLYPCAKASVFVLEKWSKLAPLAVKMEPPVFKSLESKNSFKKNVSRIKNEIGEGRVYQVNLTAPFKAKSPGSAEELFHFYSSDFAGEYKALLPLGQCSVVSFSPELFLKKSGSSLITRPIKGSISEDVPSSELLVKNPKEEAELSMIVDLLRNDLNRIELLNSAQVVAHRALMRLGYIQHTHSEIEIKTEKSLPEILQCTFPGGSISGCPKTESLQLILECEDYARQVYTGCMGWWKNNDFELNVSIRTFIQHEENLFYHAGCGIVFDSDPEKEWNEYLLKTGKLHVEL